uniref:uncharacterized protein C12orf56 homolog n=1 Tax=Monopterus albus TaxID=43700 RepID=UPI0009B44240|nr:uncharacterized protein C12orf56 homolog [Monopterus albus]
MAQRDSGAPPSRRNIKLESFLKRNTERDVFERIRTYEPCVVIAEPLNKVYMHVVLTDEQVYLTEHAPRTLTAAVSFRRVRDIELVNDLPDFLSGKDREHCQHIRITYVPEKPSGKGHDWFSRDKEEGLPLPAASSHRSSYCPSVTHTSEGYPAHRLRWEDILPVAPQTAFKNLPCASVRKQFVACEDMRKQHKVQKGWMKVTVDQRVVINISALSQSRMPPSHSDQSLTSLDGGQVSSGISLFRSHLLRRHGVSSREEREAELHLYAVSQMSRLFLHLQSSWNSFMIRSTLLLDPLYRSRCSSSSDSSPGKQRPAIRYQTPLCRRVKGKCHTGITLTNRNPLVTLIQYRWRTVTSTSVQVVRRHQSSEVCVFLVQTLEETLQGCRSHGGVYTADQLLLSTLIVQTFVIMFREMEIEAARINLLSARKGALASRMLLALICDPQLKPHSPRHVTGTEALLSEYLDAACSLLFELLLLGHESSRCSSAENFLSFGWILGVLQPHPHLLSFIDYQAQQTVLVLSDPEDSVPSPLQSVLLFQRCRLLLACLQYNFHLAQHLRSHFREEFRYSVKPSCAEEKLPACYLISRPTVRLVKRILALILHREDPAFDTVGFLQWFEDSLC